MYARMSVLCEQGVPFRYGTNRGNAHLIDETDEHGARGPTCHTLAPSSVKHVSIGMRAADALHLPSKH